LAPEDLQDLEDPLDPWGLVGLANLYSRLNLEVLLDLEDQRDLEDPLDRLVLPILYTLGHQQTLCIL
jgi:hypothetical protein